MQTLADFLLWAEEYFIVNNLVFGHGTNNAWDEAVAIARYVLALAPNESCEVLTRKLQVKEKEQLLALANRRVLELLPIPYLTNEAWFCKEKYYVDQRVIIPRSPFAELITNKFQPWLKDKQILTILDLCTGSGCIAIACAKAFPTANIDAVDISQEALEIANYNVKQHQVVDRVNIIYSDLFNALTNKQYDLIISNPPYVSKAEHYYLPQEYHHEPILALVSGNDGLACVKRILKQAKDFLTPQGLLFVELGNSWKQLTKQLPNFPGKWLNFANGGEGVFMLTKEQLINQ